MDIRLEAKHEGDKTNGNIPECNNIKINQQVFYTMQCISAQNSKRKTGSVDLRLANLFANGSALAVVQFGELGLGLGLGLWSYLASPLGFVLCQRLITTPTHVIGCGFVRIEDGKLTGC